MAKTLEELTIYKPRAFTKQHSKKERDLDGITYIVVHYAGVPGLTAHNLCDRFCRTTEAKSTHYTVDENEIWQVCDLKYTAWHCGAKKYKHKDARNENAIGVDLCEKITDLKGKNSVYASGWYFPRDTVKRAAELCAALCLEYGISWDHVIRHYDVTGKICPAPFCGNVVSSYTHNPRQEDWRDFLRLVSDNITDLMNRPDII